MTNLARYGNGSGEAVAAESASVRAEPFGEGPGSGRWSPGGAVVGGRGGGRGADLGWVLAGLVRLLRGGEERAAEEGPGDGVPAVAAGLAAAGAPPGSG